MPPQVTRTLIPYTHPRQFFPSLSCLPTQHGKQSQGYYYCYCYHYLTTTTTTTLITTTTVTMTTTTATMTTTTATMTTTTATMTTTTATMTTTTATMTTTTATMTTTTTITMTTSTTTDDYHYCYYDDYQCYCDDHCYCCTCRNTCLGQEWRPVVTWNQHTRKQAARALQLHGLDRGASAARYSRLMRHVRSRLGGHTRQVRHAGVVLRPQLRL